MATIDDLVTVQKNGVIGINNIAQTLAYINGKITSTTVSSTTLIVTGAGRIVSYSITVKGSTAGTIYNATDILVTPATGALVVTTAAQEVGVYPVGLHFSNGLVVMPGTGQSINVTYSLDP